MTKYFTNDPIYSLLLALTFFTSCNGQNKTEIIPSGNPKMIRTQGTNYTQVGCGFQDKTGNLWFGTLNEGVYRYDGKFFTQFTKKDGLNDNCVNEIIEDREGNLLFGTPAGICKYDGKTFAPFTDNKLMNSISISSLLEDKDGKLTTIDIESGALNATWRVYSTAGAPTVVPITAKGAASQTANLQEWQNSAGTVLGYIGATGGAKFAGLDVQMTGSAIVNIGTAASSLVGLIVRGVASQTADLQQWQNSAGIVQSRMTDIGKLFSNYLQSSYGILTGSATYAGGYNFISNPSFATTDVSLIVKAVSSQTSDLQQWQNSSGTVLAEITASGSLELNGKDIELMNIMGAF